MKKLLILSIFALSTMSVFSQSNPLNPVKWNFSAEKISDQEFEVSFTATLDKSWYVYSQNIGEDGPIPTSFNFTENSEIEFIGKTSEEGTNRKAGYDELFAMDVVKFGGTAIFKQKIKVSNGADKISGYLEYMTCDDMRCLPPTEVEFSISLK